MTTAPTVDISSLSVAYRSKRRALRVISDVSVQIAPGEAYGLVGESGCGKTTVAMALMRYLPRNAVVQSGSISFRGEDVLGASQAKLRSWRGSRMAMVYQDPGSALNPSMRVGAQMEEVFARHAGAGRREAAASSAEMLERVQVTDPARVLRRYPHELSGGQQQRVMIAMALATNPDLLVLDEPTTGLDATVEAEVLDLVEGLRSEFDTAILFISHNLGIVARLCDRVGVLYAGRLIEEGPAREIFAEPHHPYTLALLRCVPRLGARKDTRRLEPIPGSLPPLGSSLPGCVYAPRCPLAVERCRQELPLLGPVGQPRTVACHRADEVATLAPGAGAAPAAVEVGEQELLSVGGLVKTYRQAGSSVQAVAGVSFGVKRGEVFGLVGESGSGKSTLARVVVGLLDSTAGEISFDGTDVGGRRRDREARRRLQMVFQNPETALNPRHLVGRILNRSLKLLGDPMPRSQRAKRLEEVVRSVRLEPRHMEVRPQALSGGLKQRVAIARAFVGSPSLVVCDEPVSALDVSVQAAILNLLVDLQESRGASYIFISHDLAVVRYLSDRIGVMYLGQLVDVGPAEAVFTPPHHPYTEALVSAIPSLDLGSERERIRLEGTMPSPADPPSGCRFHTRCPRFLGEVCETEEPPWQEDAGGNRYRCHIPPAELVTLQSEPGTLTGSARSG